MKVQNILLTLGAVAGAAKIAKEATGIELDDVFGAMGLTRRRNRVLSNIAFLGAGALAGAGAAMLFTPKSGRETRRMIRQQADRLGHAASEVMQAGAESGRSIAARGQDALRASEHKHSPM
jgi:hypothetical protein